MNNKDLVIKPADKGGPIVVQHAVKYKTENLSELSDEKFYKKLTSDLTDSLQHIVFSYLEEAKQGLDLQIWIWFFFYN